MKKLVLILLIMCTQISCVCKISKQDVVGNYIYTEGDTFFEAFELSEDGSFSSWLNNRPDASGTWKLVNCNVEVSLDSLDTPIILSFENLDAEKATIHTDDNEKSASFKRGTE